MEIDTQDPNKLVRVIAVYVGHDGLEVHETLWRGYADQLQGALIPPPMTIPRGVRFEVRLVGGLL